MLTQIINKLLIRINNLDPAAFVTLKAYYGNIVLLQVIDLQLNLYLKVETIGFSLIKYDNELKPNATIQGKLLSLTKTKGGANTNINIQGDFSLIEAIYTSIKQFDPDLWNKISPYIGEHLAYALEQGVKNSVKLSQDFMHNRSLDLTEYLQEECKILPTKFEVAEFCQQVDIINQSVQRLEAKIQHLAIKKAAAKKINI